MSYAGCCLEATCVPLSSMPWCAAPVPRCGWGDFGAVAVVRRLLAPLIVGGASAPAPRTLSATREPQFSDTEGHPARTPARDSLAAQARRPAHFPAGAAQRISQVFTLEMVHGHALGFLEGTIGQDQAVPAVALGARSRGSAPRRMPASSRRRRTPRLHLRSSITNQHSPRTHHARVRHRQRPNDLLHEQGFWIWRRGENHVALLAIEPCKQRGSICNGESHFLELMQKAQPQGPGFRIASSE